MSNRGYNFEIEEVEFWRISFPDSDEEYIFRVEGSGQSKNATKTGRQSLLEGDVSVELSKMNILPKDILIECKHYKTPNKVVKSFAVRKEWLDQALHEAQKNGRFSIVAVKFKGVYPKSKELQQYCWADGKFSNAVHYIIPRHHFLEIIKYIQGIKEQKQVDLSDVSTEELLEELKRRLK